MAYTADQLTDFYPKRPLMTRLLDTLALWTTAVADANPYMRRVRALQGMSDRQLNALGVPRDEIVHHVFKHAYYR
ncbi:DUF1127 domain-containing protein [Roseovarius aestuariivivens]|uniref:DUF1127 domain-containing protein n=1 Tax=Roseovarius aestuariivivens TaxID=1888910 RepID=UPI00108123AC|nr:DUF1127 domain-containing protein [Roseovarius aestuariivivens]